jgi:hypothetical protein
MSSSKPTPPTGVNNILSFNGHGAKASGKSFTLGPDSNVYILVPFGLDVELPPGQTKTKTDTTFKGLDVCYTSFSPDSGSFEEIIYSKDGKLKLVFNDKKSPSPQNVDAKWHLYKPGDVVPNVNYFAWKKGDTAAPDTKTCNQVSDEYDSFISTIMKECLKLGSDKLNKKVCALFVSDSKKTTISSDGKTTSAVLTDKGGYRHLKLKICGDDPDTATTTLEELAKNCRELVEFSRNVVKTSKASSDTAVSSVYASGYDDANILPKSGKDDPIILMPFTCNSCNETTDIPLINYTSDLKDVATLSDIIADLSGGGVGSGKSAPPPTPSCNIDASNKYITNITPECQQDIFGLVPSTSSEQDILKKHLSVLRTDTQNATNDNLPPGSATIVDLNYYREKFEYPKNTQKLGIDNKNNIDVNSFNKEILFVIQAAPGGFRATNASKESLKNCVYNSLYLANAKGIKGIAFPLIGAGIFGDFLIRDKVVSDKNELYNLLLEGVTDYFKYFTNSIIEIILFADFKPKKTDNDNFEKIFTEFKHSFKAKLIRKEDDIFIATDKYNKEESNSVKINALVNAANTEITFDGVDGIALAFKNMLGGELKDKESGLNENIFTIPDVITKQGTEIKKAFKTAVDAYIAKPSAASSPPPKPEPPKKPFDGVLTTLQGQLDKNGDPSVNLNTLKVAKVKDDEFLYPIDGDEANKKNLNSAEPTIKGMIEAFESADGVDTNFYLGACRSIQAAYQLERGDKTDDTSPEAMRAKLLLNLRKNSLLLKVQARWDYKEMKMGVVSGPPDTIKDLMNYSLQDTIEYYSQDSVTGNAEFKALNIKENPTPAIVDGAEVSGVDGRFVKGIDNVLGHSCYFSSVNQLLFTNEDFLQFLIISICKPIEESSYMLTSDKSRHKECNIENTKKLIELLKLYFKQWMGNKSLLLQYTNEILTLLNIPLKGHQDVSEVLTNYFNNLLCGSNPYLDKFINNLMFKQTETTEYPEVNNNLKYIKKPTKTTITYPCFLTITKDSSFAPIDTLTITNLLKQKTTSIPQKIQYDENSFNNHDDIDTFNNYKVLLNNDSIINLIKNICSNNDKVNNLKKLNAMESTSINLQIMAINSVINNDAIITPFTEFIETFYNLSKNIYIKQLLETDFTKEVCTNVNKIYDYIQSENTKLITPPHSEPKEWSETFKFDNINKYFMIFINRTFNVKTKNNMKVDVEKILMLEHKIYILQGYSVHIGDDIRAGHYVYVKCDPKTGDEKVILDDGSIKGVSSRTDEQKQTGSTLILYKRADESGQGGGGFKPRHNPITNHSKSRHNSSFKVSSSSKSKGKSHSRSHTQRVK